jgi:hypothetical protein
MLVVLPLYTGFGFFAIPPFLSYMPALSRKRKAKHAAQGERGMGEPLSLSMDIGHRAKVRSLPCCLRRRGNIPFSYMFQTGALFDHPFATYLFGC